MAQILEGTGDVILFMHTKETEVCALLRLSLLRERRMVEHQKEKLKKREEKGQKKLLGTQFERKRFGS